MDGPLKPGAYMCPHCPRTYDSTWIKRHLIEKHDYRWWDNWNVYKPEIDDEVVDFNLLPTRALAQRRAPDSKLSRSDSENASKDEL